MKITRTPYNWLVRLLLPLALIRLWWRGRREKGYRKNWRERLGYYPTKPQGPVIWVHAVSVGETRAAAALLVALHEKYPRHHLVLTHTTPTGRATRLEVDGIPLTRCYLPYDLPTLVDRFLDHFKPSLGLLMETEIWPNLVIGCHRRYIPLWLVNARLSEKSARGYARAQPLTSHTLSRLSGIAAQTENDAERFRKLGANNISVVGNLKFDSAHDYETNHQILPQLVNLNRPIWLAASTREGEEALLISLLPFLRKQNALLLLVPRHPQRFNEVAELLTSHDIVFQRRSKNLPLVADTEVLLGDSMGEMSRYFHSAQLAVMGGTLLPYGGQNLIEATAAGCPVLLGPHTFNFDAAARDAIKCGAALRVQGIEDLSILLPDLLKNPTRRATMGEAGLAFTKQFRGATQRIVDLLPLLSR
jgi:3-deoxy-D-manno-octulosonic-acid transferase